MWGKKKIEKEENDSKEWRDGNDYRGQALELKAGGGIEWIWY